MGGRENPRPRGDKVDEVEESRRLDLITSTYLRVLSRRRVLEEAALWEPPMPPSTVDRYLAKMRERWAKPSEAKREEVLAFHRDLLLDLIADAREAKQRNAVAQFERLLAEVDGVRVHRVAVGKSDDLRDLPDEDLAAIDAIVSKPR